MLRKSLLLALALVLLPVSMVISTGTANAAVETEKSLNGRLLTDAELKAALASNGIKLTIADTADLKNSDFNIPEMVVSGRLWSTADGSVLYDMLVSYIDGRAIPESERGEILNGNMAKTFLGNAFDKVEYGGELKVVGPNDILHAFNVTEVDGTTYQVATVSFIRGNIFGLVLYATADNQLGEVLSAFGGQTAKLPQ